jgi:hypothetical protein
MLGDEYELRHCCYAMFDDIDKWEEIATTYRDPYRIAASWANRDRFRITDAQIERTWFRQWDCWDKVRGMSTIYPVGELTERLNTFEDKYKLHQALNNNDMEHFYKHVPAELLEIPLKLCLDSK